LAKEKKEEEKEETRKKSLPFPASFHPLAEALAAPFGRPRERMEGEREMAKEELFLLYPLPSLPWPTAGRAEGGWKPWPRVRKEGIWKET